MNCQLVLRPLGYVEKADGQVEAVVEEAGQIYIVHAGETFADNYKVLTISRDEVQVADVRESGFGSRESEEPVESRELRVERRVAERSQKLEARSQNKANVEIASGVLIRGASEPLSRDCQLPTANCEPAPSDSGNRTPDSRAQLGFVKRANGRVETIVADGEHVRLAQGEPTLLARIQESGVRSQESEVGEAVERQEPSAESAPTVAAAPRIRKPKVDDPAHADFGLPDPLQPEALAHYDRNLKRLVNLKDNLWPQTQTIANQVADELAEARSGELGIQPPEISDTSGSGPPIPHQIGYIERVLGQAEAIVAVGGEVHFVREGDVFAERFRALSVSPSWVEIEELPLGRRTSAEVVMSPGPTLAGAPEPRGPTSHSPPVRDAARSGGPEFSPGPGPPGQRPPPRAGPVDAGLGPPAARITLKPVGFAVKGDGKTVAFVAVEGEVFLAREGEVFASGYKVLRVTATAVEIMPETLHSPTEMAWRPFGSSAGKPTPPTASNDSGLISLDSITSAGNGIPDLAGTTAAAVSPGGEGFLSGLGLSEGDLHSPAGMLDNPGHRH